MVLVLIKKQRWARTSAQVKGISSCFERKKYFLVLYVTLLALLLLLQSSVYLSLDIKIQ